MLASTRLANVDNSEGDLSREQVETLCLLHAVGDGCTLDELAKRLGLARSLAPVLRRAVERLEQQRLVTAGDRAVEVTAQGRAWEKETLGLKDL